MGTRGDLVKVLPFGGSSLNAASLLFEVIREINFDEQQLPRLPVSSWMLLSPSSLLNPLSLYYSGYTNKDTFSMICDDAVSIERERDRQRERETERERERQRERQRESEW